MTQRTQALEEWRDVREAGVQVTTPCLILTALATSGLAPATNHPLEIGLLAVDRETFEMVDVFTRVLQADPSSVLVRLDDFATKTHTTNGLFEEMIEALPAKYTSFGDAAHAACLEAVDFVERNGAAGDCRSPLICFGTEWLGRWLAAHFRPLSQMFRGELDMSTVLDVRGQVRPKGNLRAESTLTELYAALKGIQP